jgi:four helix bundle protein
MAMIDFKTLQVWQKAHRFTLMIYKASQSFPREELYGLTNQIRRASISIPSNIAEGCGRDSDPELARFAQIAMGSASEVEYQLLLAHDLGYIQASEFSELEKDLNEVKRMLNAFIRKVRERI